MSLLRINPETLHRSPHYSQATLVAPGASLVFIGGQNAVDASGGLVGPGDVVAQTQQVMTNVTACLDAAGVSSADLVSLDIKVVDGVDLAAAQQAAAPYLDPESPPLITVSVVTRLALDGALVEAGAVAAVPNMGDAVWLGRYVAGEEV
ncbi:hypothetical protein GCM10009785_11750 [Brooklawnia cerclae]|uniref:Enamine deaminase RidA (YjgF/YER057c/UK114 family) n=1 Tax=Brooklawnia cerclae TaxID=349934 RepID=A0ABX0SPA7_9ACTN|nr:RidA family protein [Brooklawnia cerclae]NIH58597.1 enamine deaminase RidA (YjgF/YER057c/UK114 family) [Brooklawnia cerclae]